MRTSSKFFSRFFSFALTFSLVFSPLVQTLKLNIQAAAPPTPDPVFTVLAAGARASVLNPTDGYNTTDNNGSEWYYNVNASMGFAPEGSTVQLTTADTSDLNDPLRISWHTNGTGNLQPGWRAGTNTDLGSDWNRYIYQSDNIPVYYPYGPQTNVSPSSLDGWSLCYEGTYGQSISLVSLWSQCTGNYLLYAAKSEVAHNLIDVKVSGTSVLDSPGGYQLETSKNY